MTEKEREKQAAEPWNEIIADQTEGRDPAEICETNAELFTMRRNYAANVAGRFGAALDEIEKAEKETLQAATVRGEKILALFELEPPDALHKTLTQTQNYTAAAWYRAANKNFTAGNYAAALDVFIDNETAAAISPKIDSVKKKYEKGDDGQQMTLAAFLSRFPDRSETDDGAQPPKMKQSYFDQIMDPGQNAPINGQTSDTFYFGTDKVNKNLTKFNTDGAKISLRTDSVKKRKDGKPPVYIYASLDMSEIRKKQPELANVLNRLTYNDDLIYWAIASLWKDWTDRGRPGNPWLEITAGQILKEAGITSRPNSRYYKEIETAMTKFCARFTLDNSEEMRANYKYTYMQYEGPLLHFDRMKERKFANGQTVEITYRIFDAPILLTFAESRRQITAVPIEAQMFPPGVNRTERNLAINKILLEHVAAARHSGKRETIKLQTVYKALEITNKTEKQRTRQTLSKLLAHHKRAGVVSYYDDSDTQNFYIETPRK